MATSPISILPRVIYFSLVLFYGRVTPLSRIGGDKEGTFGVFCRRKSDNSSFIFFIITGNSNYSIGRWANNRYKYQASGQNLSIIKSGTEVNNIRASCIDTSLTLEVNKAIIATATDELPVYGNSGMYASAISKIAGVDVLFDDFVLAIP